MPRLKLNPTLEKLLISKFKNKDSSLCLNCDYGEKGIHWVSDISQEDLLDIIKQVNIETQLNNSFDPFSVKKGVKK